MKVGQRKSQVKSKGVEERVRKRSTAVGQVLDHEYDTARKERNLVNAGAYHSVYVSAHGNSPPIGHQHT